MQSNSSHIIAEFSSATGGARTAFFSSLEQTPDRLREVVINNYEARLTRGNGRPMLGEYAPWLLSQVLPLRHHETPDRLAVPWMHLYAYTLFMDDVLDVDNKRDAAPLLIASGLILQRGIASLYEVMPAGSEVRVRLDTHFLEAAYAAIKEIEEHKQRVRRFSSDEVSQLGEKVSLLKLCATCLLMADGVSSIDGEVMIPVESLATGMQLLDDVADWEEDWQAANYSHLLTETICRLQDLNLATENEARSFIPREILTSMIFTGCLEDCIADGIKCLQQVRASSNLNHNSPAYRLVQAIIEENSAFAAQVRTARHSCEEALKKSPDRRWIAVLSHNGAVQDQVQSIHTGLQIVAQNT